MGIYLENGNVNCWHDETVSVYTKTAVLLGESFSTVCNGIVPEENLIKLGIHESDRRAQRIMADVLLEMGEARIEQTSEAHVFDVFSMGRQVGTFEIGERNASMKLLRREIAFLLGLENYATCGLFCTVTDLEFYPENPPTKILFTGKRVQYEMTTEKTDSIVMGLLQSCPAPSTVPVAKEEVCKFLLNHILSPLNIQAGQSRLSDAHLDCLIPGEVVHTLKTLVEKWDIESIIKSIAEKEIVFYDNRAENASEKGKSRSTDKGGNILLHEQALWAEDLYSEQTNPNMNLVLPQQIRELRDRLYAIKQKVTSRERLCLRELTRPSSATPMYCIRESDTGPLPNLSRAPTPMGSISTNFVRVKPVPIRP